MPTSERRDQPGRHADVGVDPAGQPAHGDQQDRHGDHQAPSARGAFPIRGSGGLPGCSVHQPDRPQEAPAEPQERPQADREQPPVTRVRTAPRRTPRCSATDVVRPLSFAAPADVLSAWSAYAQGAAEQERHRQHPEEEAVGQARPRARRPRSRGRGRASGSRSRSTGAQAERLSARSSAAWAPQRERLGPRPHGTTAFPSRRRRSRQRRRRPARDPGCRAPCSGIIASRRRRRSASPGRDGTAAPRPRRPPPRRPAASAAPRRPGRSAPRRRACCTVTPAAAAAAGRPRAAAPRARRGTAGRHRRDEERRGQRGEQLPFRAATSDVRAMLRVRARVQLRQHRQHLVPDPVAGEGGVGVRRSSRQARPRRRQLLAHLLPGHVDQRPDERRRGRGQRGQGVHAAGGSEAVEARSRRRSVAVWPVATGSSPAAASAALRRTSPQPRLEVRALLDAPSTTTTGTGRLPAEVGVRLGLGAPAGRARRAGPRTSEPEVRQDRDEQRGVATAGDHRQHRPRRLDPGPPEHPRDRSTTRARCAVTARGAPRTWWRARCSARARASARRSSPASRASSMRRPRSPPAGPRAAPPAPPPASPGGAPAGPPLERPPQHAVQALRALAVRPRPRRAHRRPGPPARRRPPPHRRRPRQAADRRDQDVVAGHRAVACQASVAPGTVRR